jgi:hypothetical protein
VLHQDFQQCFQALYHHRNQLDFLLVSQPVNLPVSQVIILVGFQVIDQHLAHLQIQLHYQALDHQVSLLIPQLPDHLGSRQLSHHRSLQDSLWYRLHCSPRVS